MTRDLHDRPEGAGPRAEIPPITDSLVESGTLHEHLGDPRIRVVDMRGIVQTSIVEPGVQSAAYRGAREAYLEAHIPGAVYLDWTRDIVDTSDPVPVQVAPLERFAAVMEEHGIGDDTFVVAYDDHPASQFATRLWWALRYYGHDKVGILNGGWGKWKRDGRPVSKEIPVPEAARFTPVVQAAWRTTAEQLLKSLGSRKQQVVDARDEAQFTGAVRRGPRGGHIPGAAHLPREALFGADGVLLPPDRLDAAVKTAGLSSDRPVVAYCNGGVAATAVLFALHRLNFQHLSNYDGSWNEWGTREDLPVEL